MTGTTNEYANEHELALKDEVYQTVGCAMEVLNTLGHGLLEKCYENALVVEFKIRGVPWKQQPRYAVVYKGVQVGEFVPDLVTFDQIIVEAKTVDYIGDHEKGQILNYLEITGLKVGVILNFKRSILEWKRFIL